MEETVDLREYFGIVKKRFWIVALITIIAVVVSGVISFFMLNPVYEAKSTLIVNADKQAETQIVTGDQITVTQKLAVTYGEIIKSRIVLDDVIKNLKLENTYESLSGQITVSPVNDTQIISISVQDTNPQKARDIANEIPKVFEKEAKAAQESKEATPLIHQYTLAQMVEYVNTVSAQELDFIKEAYKVNYELLQEGLKSPKTTYGPYLLKKNGGFLVSEDERKTASLFCNGAIEARVIGLSKPAMSITGSGAHGIIATMPLYAVYKINNYTDEQLLRATALSYLVCMYIKEYSGKLSAFCGCAIAAGTGMACALTWLKGAGAETMEKVINNMASSITGMICDGGNQGCAMKGIVAVDAAFDSVELAMDDVYIYNAHGINGATPEETMHNMGLIASPGMTGTEKTIVDILDGKNK